MPPPTELCVLGDFAWDVLVRTDRELQPGGDTIGEVMLLPGGSAANVAVWATRCGASTTFIGKVGGDRMGELAAEDLSREGVHHHLIPQADLLTGSVAVFVDDTGERSMVSGRGADFFLLPAEVPEPLVMGSPHLHLTAWSFFEDPPRSAARHAAALTRRAGGTLSFDPGSFQMIGEMGVERFLAVTQDIGIDVIFPNFEEGAVLTGADDPDEIARRLATLYPDVLVVLKLDADGALVWRDGVGERIAPAESEVLDTTGAGDSFVGAFLARYIAGATAVEAARFAVIVAGWVVERRGARPIGAPPGVHNTSAGTRPV